jgi:zinc protease
MSKMSFAAVSALVLCAAVGEAQRKPVALPPKPAVPAEKPFVHPRVTVDSLPNGLRFAVVEDHEIPLVVVRTLIAGAAPYSVSHLDPPGKAGAWGLVMLGLREGTTSRSNTQITNEFGELGTDMLFPSVGTFTPPWFRSARSTWKPSLALMGDMLMNPTFPEASFTRIQATAAGAMDRLVPPSHASRVMISALFGPDSPNAQFATSATLRSVTRDDVIALHAQYLRPQNVTLVVGGDVTVAEVRATLAEVFGKWERGGTTHARIVAKAPAAPAPTTIYLKDLPGQPQATLMMGQLVPGRDAPDAFAIEALTAVLGDFTLSSQSRAYNAVRMERGLSYSVAVQLPTARPAGEPVAMYASLSVAPALIDTAVSVVLGLFRDLRQAQPVTASELEFARSSIVGRQPRELERIDALTFNVLALLRDGAAPDYTNQWTKRMTSLTLAEAQAAAAKHIDASRVAIAVVGDRAKLEAPLRALGLPLVIVDK